MALAQCEEFLVKHPQMIRIETDDTAGSCRLIQEQGLTGAAAISSSLSAKLYDLRILAKDIGKDKNNYTRFLIISSKENYPDNADKTSIVIRAKNTPGSLFSV